MGEHVTLLVLQDDTVSCANCYEEEFPSGGCYVPAHREVFGRATQGECASCGVVAGASLASVRDNL